MPHVFIMFLYHFGIFYWTNLLTQYQNLFIMSVHCRKGQKSKVLRKIRINYRNSFSPGDHRSPKGRCRGRPQPPDAPQAWSRVNCTWVPPG